MPITAILFDLDGTLTDPKPGITRSIQYALSELGYPSPTADDLLWCIGPPLQQSFATLLQTSDKVLIERAVTLYRDRYATIGLFENSLYPQILETLETIRAAGDQTELDLHGADRLAHSPVEIPKVLLEYAIL